MDYISRIFVGFNKGTVLLVLPMHFSRVKYGRAQMQLNDCMQVAR